MRAEQLKLEYHFLANNTHVLDCLTIGDKIKPLYSSAIIH